MLCKKGELVKRKYWEEVGMGGARKDKNRNTKLNKKEQSEEGGEGELN